ncbi:hypothetical protein BCR34DRAFT_245396 [Clohesyomyces aquaticus]|uniref:Uncharacterized protein n=1 Tax=Clohesyomyces aquaticus TaxID=1231657 RepID=A0A1Y1ZUV2_9PLEO|nr:hypothetical protein BCR34DRAFT_245396 [Clohesyomyces aquaticus]
MLFAMAVPSILVAVMRGDLLENSRCAVSRARDTCCGQKGRGVRASNPEGRRAQIRRSLMAAGLAGLDYWKPLGRRGKELIIVAVMARSIASAMTQAIASNFPY